MVSVVLAAITLTTKEVSPAERLRTLAPRPRGLALAAYLRRCSTTPRLGVATGTSQKSAATMKQATRESVSVVLAFDIFATCVPRAPTPMSVASAD